MTAKDKLGESGPADTISPSFPTGPRHFSIQGTTGILCFVLAFLFYYGAVLRIELKHTHLLDLDPYPDSVEYFAQANSILKEGSAAIQIGYDKLPSRYPPGYPLLMLPWLVFQPDNGILAPFRTNQTIGALLLTGSFMFYLVIGRPLAGGCAALLIATQPAFITFSRSSISDLSAGAVTVLAFALVYLGLAQRRRWLIYCAAFVLGLSLCIRPQLLFMAPLLIAMALFPANVSWTRWFMHCCLALAAFAVGFGAVGYPLASHTRLSPWAIVLIAIATGILCVVGTITLLARWALRGTPIAADEADEIQGQFALVTRDIPTGAPGEISYERLGKKEVRTLARSLSERPLAAGTEVVIDRIENGVAFVEEWTVVEQRL